MPNIDDVFQSKYMKAADLADDDGNPIDLTVTIADAWTETYQDKRTGKEESKIGLAFKETKKGMLCNLTNSRRIAQLLGSSNTDKWIGKRITLYQTEVDFQGEMKPAIRVRGKLPGHESRAGVGTAAPKRAVAVEPDDPRTFGRPVEGHEHPNAPRSRTAKVLDDDLPEEFQ